VIPSICTDKKRDTKNVKQLVFTVLGVDLKGYDL
jgi:hypothetical protein